MRVSGVVHDKGALVYERVPLEMHFGPCAHGAFGAVTL